jgi:ankyrin repeat protein
LLNAEDVEVDARDNFGRTPLSYAAEHEVAVELLLKADADVNSRDSLGGTPLSYGVKRKCVAVVEQLLRREGVEVDLGDDYSELLLSMTRRGDKATVKFLLEKGVKADSTDCNKRTPLSYAVEWGHRRVIKLLLHRTVMNLNLGWTPLFYAYRKGDRASINLLRNAGATY